MKIALLNLWRVNNARGGTEKVFFNMAEAMTRLGHDVVCFASDSGDGEPPYLNKNAGYRFKNCASGQQ